MKRNKKLLIISILLVSLSVSFYSLYFVITSYTQANTEVAQVETQGVLQEFTIDELATYNGTNQDLPIYLAYHGDVFDVTQGRKFYQEGGAYHFLAGTDATKDLDIAGGSIIKSKYAVIGKLVETK